VLFRKSIAPPFIIQIDRIVFLSILLENVRTCNNLILEKLAAAQLREDMSCKPLPVYRIRHAQRGPTQSC
jgi:hypothetical protein